MKPNGRPSFKPTAAMRQRVAAAAGGGMSHEEIAIGLGISRNTLEKHFAKELTEVAYAKRIEALDGLQKAAKKGNAAAVRLYLQMTPSVAIPAQPEAEKPPKAPAKGKKELADDAAKDAQAGTGWDGLLPKHGTTLQ